MGIHGIYQEIGKGKRIALLKYATQTFEEKGRPLRIAVDTSIWLFQIQATKGGSNPALRTFYYRLLRLINHTIHPIFVFDGPNKPPFKRNKRTGPNVASIPEFLAKQLLKMFGFPVHVAPGEAEAECALLQREGIVDAVFTEDVDALMFGSGITLRSWSPEQKSSKVPTHVNLYDAKEIKAGPSQLDREGMILVALMSGGDYLPEGIPDCGPKTACEAARAGFGRDLCRLARSDKDGLKAWKARLSHELVTNESKFFKRKHGKLTIPDDFPRQDVMGYYTHPAVSTAEALVRLQNKLKWDQTVDFPALREFTKDAFDWTKLGGAKHFIRTLAPAMLVRQLRIRSAENPTGPSSDLEQVAKEEGHLVKTIHSTRQHGTTDLTPEIRIGFIPNDLVKINLDEEEPDDELPVDDDSEIEELLPVSNEPSESTAGPQKRGPTKYDPTTLERIWVPEAIVRVGVPLKIEDWEASKRNAHALLQQRAQTNAATNALSKKGKEKKSATDKGMRGGELDRFTRVTKPGASAPAKSVSSKRAPAGNATMPKAKARTTTVLVDDVAPTSSAPVPQTISLLSSPPATPSRMRQGTLDRFFTPSKDRIAPPVFNISSSPARDDAPEATAATEESTAPTRRRKRGAFRRVQTLPANLSPIHSDGERTHSPDPDLPSPAQINRKRSRPSPPMERDVQVNMAIEVLDLAQAGRTPLGSISGNRSFSFGKSHPRNEDKSADCLDLPPESFNARQKGIDVLDLSSDLFGASDQVPTSDFLALEKLDTADATAKERSRHISPELVPASERIASSDWRGMDEDTTILRWPSKKKSPAATQQPVNAAQDAALHSILATWAFLPQSALVPVNEQANATDAPLSSVDDAADPFTFPTSTPYLPSRTYSGKAFLRSRESLPGHWQWSDGTSPEAVRMLSTAAATQEKSAKPIPSGRQQQLAGTDIWESKAVTVLDLTQKTIPTLQSPAESLDVAIAKSTTTSNTTIDMTAPVRGALPTPPTEPQVRPEPRPSTSQDLPQSSVPAVLDLSGRSALLPTPTNVTLHENVTLSPRRLRRRGKRREDPEPEVLDLT